MFYRYINQCHYVDINLFDVLFDLSFCVSNSTIQCWGDPHPGDGEEKTVIENSSGFNTKEILGYLWTPSLLKKHDRAIPKRLQTIQHQGKSVKGAIMEEWVLGILASEKVI